MHHNKTNPRVERLELATSMPSHSLADCLYSRITIYRGCNVYDPWERQSRWKRFMSKSVTWGEMLWVVLILSVLITVAR